MSTSPSKQSTPPPPSPYYTWFAVAMAGLASLGGVYLYWGEDKIPCPLCYYQRSFAYATLAILLAGLLGGFNEKFAVAALALPVAFAGLGVAMWHVNLIRTGVLECPAGMFNLSSNAPMQSAIVFGLCCAALVLDAYQAGRPGGTYQHVLGGAAAGLVVAAICIFPNPAPPDAPKEPYPEGKILTCRRPYVAPAEPKP